MGRLSNAWRALTGKSEPGVVFGDPATLNAFQGLVAGAMPFGAPPMRGERELYIAQKRHPILHSILAKLGESIGSTAWQLYIARNKMGQPEKRWPLRNGSFEQRKRYRRKSAMLRNDLEEITDHPLLDLLHSFNPLMPGACGMAVVNSYLELKGDAFIGIERNAAGMPVQLWPIPGYWIYRTPYRGSPFYHCNFGTWVADVPERDMIWLKKHDLENPFWRGSGTGEATADEIEIDEYAAKTQKALFYNHQIPGAVLSFEGASKEEIDVAKEKFQQMHGGYWNAARIFYTNLKTELKPLARTFVDSDMAQLRKDARDKIVNTWGIPPEILGILENSNKATIAVAQYIYAIHCIMPRLEFFRSALQARLAPEFDPNIHLDYEDPTPNDADFALSVCKVAPWSRSKNEYRDMQGLPPVDGGDDEFPPMPTSTPAAPRLPEEGGGLPELPKSFRQPDDDPPWTFEIHARASGAEEDDDYLDRGRVDDVVAAVEEESFSGVNELMDEQMKDWVKKTADEMGLQVDFMLVNPRIAEYVRQRAGDKIKGLAKVNDTTREALRDSLGDGIDAGESIADLTKRVTSVFEDAEGYRAEAIARTETTRAAGWGSLECIKESDLDKQWVATRDGRTRDDHEDLDGTIEDSDKPFTIGSLEADHPGDFDDPSEDINCRCAVVAAEKGKALRADLDEVWKAWDKAVTPWQTKLEGELKASFRKQRAAVLEALKAA